MKCWGIEVQGFVIHDGKLDKTFEVSEQDYETYCKANRSRIVSEELWFNDDKFRHVINRTTRKWSKHHGTV